MGNSVTRIAILLDTSSSMRPIKGPALDSFNAINQSIQDNAKAGQKTMVSLWTFGSRITEKFVGKDASILRFIQDHEYRTDEGSTRLNDALITAAQSLNQQVDLLNDEEACLVICVTDGGENASSNPSKQVKSMFERLQKTGTWTVVLQVPPGMRKSAAETYGIPIDNVREWEQTRRGAQEMGESTTMGLSAYYDVRRSGGRSVEKFFATADLSKVSDADLKSLTDVSHQFKELKINKGEIAIRDFVQAETGREYVIGSGFYELTKQETVQPQKAVLIRKRGEKAIYGGVQARRLLGLPDNAHAKLTIKNLSEYQVWIESTSVNRVLVRGTTLMLNLNQQSSKQPTWDHVSAEKAAQDKQQQSQTPAPASKAGTWPPAPAHGNGYNMNPPAPAQVQTPTTKRSISKSTVNRTKLVEKQTRDAKGRFGAKKKV